LVNCTQRVAADQYKDGDATVRSVYEFCSQRDAIGNVAVLLASLSRGNGKPHGFYLVVAGIMAGLFHTACQDSQQSLEERRADQELL
jgi:hypothetical protein